jgi:hypothetical protein
LGVPESTTKPESVDSSRAADPGQELLAELLRCGHQVHVTAHGNSMHPTIKHGERVIVTPLADARLRRGDIVYVQLGDGGYVLHRVLRRFMDGRIQTRGDANWRLDSVVERQAVLGCLRQTAGAGSRLSACARSVHCSLRLVTSWCAGQRERLAQRLRTRSRPNVGLEAGN